MNTESKQPSLEKRGQRFRKDFFLSPCLEIAPKLIGSLLVRKLHGNQVRAGKIVEVEAYLGVGQDEASHAYRRKTTRNQSMFEEPGRLYVYRSYGIHHCVNIVCEPPGQAAAILIRAIEPCPPFDAMYRARKLSRQNPTTKLCNGPGKLCQALGIQLQHDGLSLFRGEFSLYQPASHLPPPQIQQGPRIGISAAREKPYRFYEVGNPFVSVRKKTGKGK